MKKPKRRPKTHFRDWRSGGFTYCWRNITKVEHTFNWLDVDCQKCLRSPL